MTVVMIDTHVAVALFRTRTTGLSNQAKKLIDGSVLCYSPIVSFELELLNEIGRLRLGASEICSFLNHELQITESPERLSDIVRHALPLRFIRDPFDRLIVAHADLLRAPLITLDERMHEHYGRSIK